MAELINPEYDHQYISFTQLMRVFSDLRSYTFEESKDREFVRRMDKAGKTFRVTKLRNAVKQLLSLSDLQPVYEITSTLVLVNPRYEFNQIMRLLKSEHVDALSDELALQVEMFTKFYESTISDEHVKTIMNQGTLATPLVEYLTPADFQRAENGEIDDTGLYVNTAIIASQTLPLQQIDKQVYRVDLQQVRQALTDDLLRIDQIADLLDVSYKTVTDLLQKSDLALSDAQFVRDRSASDARLLMAFDRKAVTQQLKLALQRISDSADQLADGDGDIS